MKIEQQVCSLKQSIRLKELGVVQDSIWVWIYSKENIISTNNGLYHYGIANEIISDNDGGEFDSMSASAFSVAELGVALPDLLVTDKQYEFVTIKEADDCWLVRYVRGNNILDCYQDAGDKTEAEVKAKMIIHLLETNLITAEEVNNRLTTVH